MWIMRWCCLGLLMAAMLSVQAQPEDALLEARIQTILQAIPEFTEIDVQATQGVVTLSGRVLTGQARERLQTLVAELEGVFYVVNAVELETGIEETISPIIMRLEGYWADFIAFIPRLIIALLALALFWLLSFLLTRWRLPYRRWRNNPLLLEFIKQLVRISIFLVGVIVALDIAGASAFVAAILGTAGVIGIAVGFAFKDIVENYLAGILIGLRQPFASRDFIEVAEHQGLVIRLTARELVLMTPQGNQVRLPNAIIFRNVLINYTRNPKRQFSIRVGVDSNADLKRVEHLAKTTLAAVKGVLTEPAPLVMIQELADFNVIIECFAWVDQRETDFFKVRSQAIRLLKEAFDKARINMPEPIMNVRLSRAIHRDMPDAPSDDVIAEAIAGKGRYVDVGVERYLEQQINEDIAMSDEEDLLKRTP